jgi:two-component system nitrogen regulation sensor histidine kinase NtrY
MKRTSDKRGGLPRSSRRRRAFEIALIIIIALVLLGTSHFEINLLQLSEQLSTNRDFFTSVVYFSLININVILIIAISFLIFRNVLKLVVDRRRGVIGSRVRTKLVMALVFFAVAPTALMFYISTRFLTESFETWFSSRVEDIMYKTREAGALVYERDKLRVESLARIALQRISVKDASPALFGPNIDFHRLVGFDGEYGLDSVKIFDLEGNLLWKSGEDPATIESDNRNFFVLASLDRFRREPGIMSRSAVEVEGGRDVVRGIAPIFSQSLGGVVGVVMTEERFEAQIIQSVEAILGEFADLKPSAELIRSSYTILLLVMVMIIVFSATWLGFYVARGIIGPIQSLAIATREVALGNYDVELDSATDDETGQLIRSFNRMTKDLKSNEKKVRRFTDQLKKTNYELESRKKYWEVVLRSISAGVISIDANENITSVNDAAERLLGIEAREVIGAHAADALGSVLAGMFWQQISDRITAKGSFNFEVDMGAEGQGMTLLVDVSRIVDENGTNMGIVVVFDDASEKVKIQRMAAWREVARRIAHEIKNPITPIKLSAQRLLRRFNNHFDGDDKKVFESAIETIVAEVDSLRDLVNEFSKFSRLPTVKKRPENLNRIIEETAQFYAMSYSQLQFDLQGLSKNLPDVPLDKEQITRVFHNIVSNAVAAILQYRAEGGKISFSTQYLENLNAVRVKAEDNGGGIAEKIKQRVTEPYFSTKAEGTGLGLTIVNQIVTDHGGYLRISGNEGEGAVIIVELPLGDQSIQS